MGLNDLIKNLDSGTKSKILGDNTTKILRYSFVQSDTESLPEDVLNKAVALYNGVNLVNKSKFRNDLIESLPEEYLRDLGFEGSINGVYSKAIKVYKNDLNRFFNDFTIEPIYREIKVEDNRENIEYAIPVYGKANGTNAFPHDYQLRLKKSLNELLSTSLNYDSKKVLITMPTGAGKTTLAMEMIVDLFRNHSKIKTLNIVWIVNSKELSEQSLNSFQEIWKQKGDRKIMAQRYFDKFNILNDEDVDKITFATFQLLTPRITGKSEKDINFLKKTDYLFIDEAHFTGADEYQEVFKTYIKYSEDPKIIGVTATPLRADDDDFTSLRSMFNSYLQLTDEHDEPVDSPIDFLIKGRFLSNVEYQVINDSSEISSKKSNKSLYYRELHESVKKACQNLISKNENTIIFAETKAHAIALSLYLKSENIENKLIVGETPNINRETYLKKLEDKKDSLSVIVNEKILATGIDVKGLNSIMVLAKIESVSTALQILGRAMRGPNNGGNESNTIYITKDNKTKLENYRLLESKALNN